MEINKIMAAAGLLCWLAGAATAAEPYAVVVPSAHPRFAEFNELLRTALERTQGDFGRYSYAVSPLGMEEARYFALAEKGRGVTVVWGAATDERQRRLIPIRIPLSKGLIGYRIGLINSGAQPRFDAVKTLNDLAAFRFGLGFGWGEVPLYRSAGLSVVESEYATLIKRVASGHIDFLSRGVNEVWSEYELYARANPGLAVERGLLLHTVYPYYFFVTPQAPELARRIETGLRLMIADGSFDRVFLKYNGPAIERSRLAERRVIEIPNPNLPADTPTDPALWYRPEK